MSTETAERPDHMRIWGVAYATDPRFVSRTRCDDGREHPVVKAHYVFRRATEIFGPRGIGWGHTAPEVERLDQPEPCLVLHTTLWYVDPTTGERGEIPTTAQVPTLSKVYIKDANNRRVKDADGKERYRMVPDHSAELKALTSAVKWALGALGFCQDLRFEERALGGSGRSGDRRSQGEGGSSAPADPEPADQGDPAQGPPERSSGGGGVDPPATAKQMALIRRLSPSDGKKNLTRRQASELITALQAEGGEG